MRSEKSRAPHPVGPCKPLSGLVFSQWDGGCLWGVLRRMNQIIKRTTLIAELRRECWWQEWQQTLGERQTKRVSVETKRSDCLFSLGALFLDNLRYSCCHGANYHSCADTLKSIFFSPALSPGCQTYISKDLLVISSFIVPSAPQALLFPLKPLSPSMLPLFHY